MRIVSPGSSLTEAHARRIGKPVLSVSVTGMSVEEALDRLVDFVESFGLHTINIAGPRESEAPGAYAVARQLMEKFIRALDPVEG